MTPGALRTLQDLAIDDEIDLIVEGRTAYVGNRQTTVRVVNELLAIGALDLVTGSFEDKIRNYTISATGHSILRRPALEQEIIRRLASRRRAPFTIIGDRIRPLSALHR